MLELNDFFIEDFKTFKGKHWFAFKDLNIFTGPNNSGKSSLIKALQLFSEGIINSDFPLLDLISGSENHGDFKQVVNNKSEGRKFGLGFKVSVPNLNQPFNILYHFQDGNTTSGNSGLASFLSLEMIDPSGVVFLGIYDHYKYWGDEDQSPLKSPFTGSDWTSMINGKINICLLKKYVNFISEDFDSSEIIEHLSMNFGEDWWFEVFREYDDFTNSIFTKRFNDLIKELAKDEYMNLASYDLKEDINFMVGDKTNEIRHYRSILTRTNYRDFLWDIVSPIFGVIEEKLTIFRINKANHIKSSDFLQGRLFNISKETDFLFQILKIQNDNRFKEFIHFSNVLFGINGFTKIEFIEQSGFTIKLHQISSKKSEEDVEAGFIQTNYFDYKYEVGEPISSIAEYGKGTINIITLILKTASILFNDNENDRDVEEIKMKNKSDLKVFKQILLVEEPEAFLHPAWQSKLADFFAYCIQKYDIQIFIETHSEYLIRRFQYLTANKEIKPEDSIIYYFNNPSQIPKGEEQVKELHLRGDGMMDEDFGPGFFDESIRLTVDLLKIQNRN